MQVEQVVAQESTQSTPQLSEKEVQKAITQAKETVQEAKLIDTFLLEFNVSQNESTHFRLEKDGIELDLDLYDFYGLTTAFEKAIDLSKQQKGYLPLLYVSYAGKQRLFTPGVFCNEDTARQALPGGNQPPESIPFIFDSNSSGTLWYGWATSVRQYAPDWLQRRLDSPFVFTFLMLVPLIVGFAIHLVIPILYVVGLMAMIAGLERYQHSAKAVDGIDIDDVYSKTGGEREFDVYTCDFTSTGDKIVIECDDIDATWTYQKNIMGELTTEGKNALDAVSIEGNECIACISSTHLDQVNEFESDCGEWQIEHLSS